MTPFLKYCLTPILLMALGCSNANQSGEAAYEGYAPPEPNLAQKTYEEEIDADMQEAAGAR